MGTIKVSHALIVGGLVVGGLMYYMRWRLADQAASSSRVISY